VRESRLVVEGEPGTAREEPAGVTGGLESKDKLGFAGLAARELEED
jgi:hypothetical protein